MGNGKSSMLTTLAEQLPTHRPIYFDGTTKDLGDIMIPSMQSIETDGCVRMIPHEELGLHIEGPIILMLDEYGKANPAVKNAMLRLMLERKVGSYSLHPDSISLCHYEQGQRGSWRPTTTTRTEPYDCGADQEDRPHGVDRVWYQRWLGSQLCLGWVKDNPQLCASFEDVKDPDENPYIFHPNSNVPRLYLSRSLHLRLTYSRSVTQFDDVTLTAALMGTIGDRGAMDLMAFVKLADQLPSACSQSRTIRRTPRCLTLPQPFAWWCIELCASLEKDWLNAWMDYMPRLDKEAQGMFANGVRAPKYSKQAMVMTNKKFTAWAMANNYMFAADKQ